MEDLDDKLPKFRTPTAGESGVLVSNRLFGNRTTLLRAAEFILASLQNMPIAFDTATEEGSRAFREAQELEYHALKILGRDISMDLAEAAKTFNWRSARTDSLYVVGASTRFRGVLEHVPAKFVAPKVPKDGAVGFWEWHSAVNHAMAASEADVRANHLPKNLSSKVVGPTIKAGLKETPVPVAVPAKPPAKPEEVDLIGRSGTPSSTLTATPPGHAGAKRKVAHVSPAGVDVASITADEMKMIVKAKEVLGMSFFEAVDVVLGGSTVMEKGSTGNEAPTLASPSAESANPKGPPNLSRKPAGSSQPFWAMRGGH